MIWKNKGVGLIGRDRLIRKKLAPFIKSPNTAFFLRGPGNVGLTALLEFLSDLNHPSRKSLIDADMTLSANLDRIITDWRLLAEGEKKPGRIAEKQELVLNTHGHTLYVDNLHLASPKVLRFLKVLSQRHQLCGAVHTISGEYKDDLRDLLSSGEMIRVRPLGRSHALELSEKVCRHYGQVISHVDVATAGGGLPGRIVTMARSGKLWENPIRPRVEEIDESPLLMAGIAVMVVLRVFGMVSGDKAMYLIGGSGMFFLLLGRLLISGGKAK